MKKLFYLFIERPYRLVIDGKTLFLTEDEYTSLSIRKGKKLTKIEGPGINYCLYCECGNVLNMTPSKGEEKSSPHNKRYFHYQCSCCQKAVYMTFVGPFPSPCDENGVEL